MQTFLPDKCGKTSNKNLKIKTVHKGSKIDCHGQNWTVKLREKWTVHFEPDSEINYRVCVSVSTYTYLIRREDFYSRALL